MRTTTIALFVILTGQSVLAYEHHFTNQKGAQLVTQDGKYLGNVNNNPYDSNSINNPYGKYGNPLSPDSINNPLHEANNPFSPNYIDQD